MNSYLDESVTNHGPCADRPPLVIVAGPTAVGKSAAAIALAKDLNGGIVSADSMQVYRRMNIGTAKTMPEEREGIPHALIDVIEPDQTWNVVLFQQMAREAIRNFQREGKLPIVCGGTGFYLQALLYDIDFQESREDLPYRTMLAQEAEKKGPEEGPRWLHEQLQTVDPVSAEEIPEGNVRRVIRALEYYHSNGRALSALNAEQQKKQPVYTAFYFVLTMPRQVLYQRIDARVDQMMAQGLLEEVRSLRAEGLTAQTQSMQGIGYRQLLAYLDGECTLEAAVDRIKLETRHFAKRQETWFRREQRRSPAVCFVNRNDFADTRAMVQWMEGRIDHDTSNFAKRIRSGGLNNYVNL